MRFYGLKCFKCLKALFCEHAPALIARERTAFNEGHFLADLVLVLFIVHLVRFTAHIALAVFWMNDGAVDFDHNRFRHFVRNDNAAERTRGGRWILLRVLHRIRQARQ